MMSRLLIITALLLTQGCGDAAKELVAATHIQPPTPSVAPAPPRFIIVGVDRTETYEKMTSAALDVLERRIAETQPGDHLLARWISDVSYRPEETFLDLELPPTEQAGPNPYDFAAK